MVCLFLNPFRARSTFAPRLQLPLYVAELFGDLAVADPEQVDASDVAASPVETPAHHGPVPRDDHLLGFEAGLRRAVEERLPETADVGLPNMSLAIRRREGVFEDAVVGHQRHHGVDVVAAERIVECVDRFFGAQRRSPKHIGGYSEA